MHENRFNPLGIGMGSRIANRYEIAKMIGAGAMSAVYKAYDKALSNQPCALKILAPQLTEDSTDLERFRSEVMITRQLTHEGIIRTFEFGQAENGLYFIAMEYLEGITLEQLIFDSSRELIPLQDVLRILKSIAIPLSYAHRQGVIHRDVKPANILIGENGQIKLTDFGLAKLGRFESKLTQAGESIGSPAYMSPEQMKGQDIDHRCDIYALGVIAFQMVTRRLPYESNSPYELGAMICTIPFPKLKKYNSNAPVWMDEFIQKACAFEPENRFQDAEELIAVIDQHMASAEGTVLAPKHRKKASKILRSVGECFDVSFLRIAPLMTFGCLIAFVVLIAAGTSNKPVEDVEARISKSSDIIKDLSKSVQELTHVAIEAHQNRDKIESFIKQQSEKTDGEPSQAGAQGDSFEENANSETEKEELKEEKSREGEEPTLNPAGQQDGQTIPEPQAAPDAPEGQ